MSCPTTYRARWVFPVVSAPVADGTVTVNDGRIVAVGGPQVGASVIDLGNVALIPGLVNTHTHLEFSDLPTPLGQPGRGFSDWIGDVIRHRRAKLESSQDPTAALTSAIETGLDQSVTAGVALLGDIATSAWPHRLLNGRSELQCTLFQEIIALDNDLTNERLQQAAAHLDLLSPYAPARRAGLSPHAPYSVHPELLSRCCHLSSRKRVPVAMHLAESREELQLLTDGSGPFVDLFAEMGFWMPGAIPLRTRPLDLLRILATADRALVIHGNYLETDEIDFLAARCEQMSVVYCPRTHTFFRHRDYPLDRMLAAGVNVALGTDSRASNPDLELFSELLTVAQLHPQVPPAQILRMGTLNGAQSLGCSADFGALASGKRATLTVIRLPDHSAADPHELLLDETSEVVTLSTIAGPATAGN